MACADDAHSGTHTTGSLRPEATVGVWNSGSVARGEGRSGYTLTGATPETPYALLLPTGTFQKQVPSFADKMHQWSEHPSGMRTLVAWTALEKEGFGASLQHHNPLLDRKVSSTSKIPENLLLKSQLVFGGRAGKPCPREYEPIEKKVFVHGAKRGD